MRKSSEFEWTGERLTTGKDNEIVIHHLHRYAIALDLVKNKIVLDIASGEGYGGNLLSKNAKNVIGVDIDTTVIEFAKSKYKKYNLEFKVGSADKIPVESNSIDVVVSFETIEHHDKHDEMFEEIIRVLKPDGILIMSSPDKLNYRDIPKFYNPFHIKELYREEFKQLIEKHFKNATIYYQSVVYGSLIVPENGLGKNFSEFEGDFEKINSHSTIKTPVYNLCIASNGSLSETLNYNFSFFNAQNMLTTILGKENEIYNSKTYKAGKIISFPLRMVRKLFARPNI
jgi:SAM-dependent methyltransferase